VVDKKLQVGFPRVRAECDFRRPARFEDELEVRLLVAEKKRKSLSYVFRFMNLSRNPPEETARGMLTIVCVAYGPDGQMSATAIPEEIAGPIEVAPAELLQV
jgi:acyl-CoA thioester hydrolase